MSLGRFVLLPVMSLHLQDTENEDHWAVGTRQQGSGSAFIFFGSQSSRFSQCGSESRREKDPDPLLGLKICVLC